MDKMKANNEKPRAANRLIDIGQTPVVRLEPFESEGVSLYAKLEGFNPTGSIKDRTALDVIPEPGIVPQVR